MTDQPAQAPIDAVITWVDGNDPAHRDKLNRYLATLGKDIPGSAHPTRFRQVGELEYCVASILRFAPWVRYLFIVTDAQTPPFMANLPAALADKVRLVDHSVIFRGFEQYLPVFSCRPIETVLWRIPELAERFIYFNDDVMLTRPVRPEDFFRDDHLVLRGRWRAFSEDQWQFRLKRSRPVRALRPQKSRPNRANHLRMQELSARASGYTERYFQIPHQPHPSFKFLHQAIFDQHPDWLTFNLSHKLRHPDQLWSFSLATHEALTRRIAQIDNGLTCALVKPEQTTPFGVRLQLSGIARRRRQAFICIQSLDNARPAVQDSVIRWLDQHIGRIDSVTAA